MWEIIKTESRGSYVSAYVVGHPNADKRGRVLLHRVVIENHLGRLLTKDEHVHHINENPKDNRLENLQVLTKAAHTALHHHKRESWIKVQCKHCGILVSHRIKATINKNVYCSISCGAKDQIRYVPHGIGQYVKGCRCDICKAGNRDKKRKEKVRRLERTGSSPVSQIY